ncbi:EAL domain-containing protein [Nakamurella deserti]|uniref:EAL domain-containing protein n=1 Tax=Nakamurella deserti TaxID=2164074 RepID=UPI000DBE985C|nr:EAL domain-containing protein [Nakamurella deserti]
MSGPPAPQHGPAPDWPALLERACRGEGLRSVYQPIVDVARGVVAGYEALIRFEDGPADPEMWFAAAARHGVVDALDAAAVRSALTGRSTLPGNCFLSVNVSPMSLVTPAVRAVWAGQGHLGGLVVELTEQTPIDSYDVLDGDLRRLRGAGAMIAIDDAGSGYAGLRHLLTIRPEIVKLDRSLIVDIDLDEGKRALVEMMGTFSGRLDAWLLAEGIERAAELEVLTRLGVPLAQGYLLARPGPAWPALDPSVALQLLTAVAEHHAGDTLRGLLQPAPTVRTVDEARSRFTDRTVDVVVLLDEHGRPTATMTAETALVGQAHPGIRFNVDTPLAEAALRAIGRDRPSRFAPLLCTDAGGRYVGIVPVERILQAAVGGVDDAARSTRAKSR